MNSLNAGSDDLIQQEIEKRAKTSARIKVLGVITMCALGARFYFKDPPPPDKPLHQNRTVKVLPGMLARMPATQRQKLTPELLAKLREADINAKDEKQRLREVLVEKTNPQTLPINPSIPGEDVFTYEKIAMKRKSIQKDIEPDRSKTVLVRLHNGRHLKANAANKSGEQVVIEFDKFMAAKLPTNMVMALSNNALTWKEPIPAGFEEIKPARGITIQLSRNLAKRVIM